MTTSPLLEALSPLLTRVEARQIEPARTVPEALISMLTLQEGVWTEIYGSIRLDLIGWLAEQITTDEARLLLADLRSEGHPIKRWADDLHRDE